MIARSIIFALLVFLAAPAVSALDAAAQTDDAPERPTVRAPSAATMEAFRELPEYRYDRYVERSESLLARAWEWFRDLLLAPFRSDQVSRLAEIAIITVGVLLVGFAILRLLRMERSPVGSQKRRTDRRVTLHEVDIQQRDLAVEIRRAEAGADYRLAIRLRFLAILQELDRRALIAFTPDKTNRTYLREIVSPDIRSDMGRLVRLFEATWYGDRAVDPTAYEDVRQSFDVFHERIHSAAS